MSGVRQLPFTVANVLGGVCWAADQTPGRHA